MHAPGCETKEVTKLFFLHKVGEPPEHPDHQIGYDHFIVEICPACNGATLEKLAHDCFDWESVYDQYEWYEMTPEEGVRLRAIAERCGQPLNPLCECSAHRSMRESAQKLPRSSWDVVFEWSAHKHIVKLAGSDDAPRFKLVSSANPNATASNAVPYVNPPDPQPFDARAIVLVVLAWPALLAAMLYSWYRFTNFSLIVNVLAVVVIIPVSLIVSGMLMSIGSRPDAASRDASAGTPP